MLTNNDILKKLRVAHKFHNEDIVKVLKLADFEISKGALGDMFRNEDHPNFVEAGDQILRNFLNGLVIHLRGPRPKKKEVEKDKVNEKSDSPIIKSKGGISYTKKNTSLQSRDRTAKK